MSYTLEESKHKDLGIPQKNHCRDCKHAGFDMDGNYCGHNESLAVSAGFGRSCACARGNEILCGKEGRLFEAKT